MSWRDLLDTPGFLDMYLRALLAGGAVVIMCSVLSVLVVVKKLGFVGQGVSHSAFGGIGVAAVVGVLLPTWGLTLTLKQTELLQLAIIIGFCIAAALGMAAVSDRSGSKGQSRGSGDGVPADTAIGLFLVASMALGAVLVQVSRRLPGGAGRVQSWESILFGSILTVDQRDVGMGCLISALVLGAVWWWRRPMLFWIFDEDSAPAFGVPVRAMRTLTMVLLAAAIVIAMRLAGVVLATALLVLPGATALKLSSRLTSTLAISIACGLIGLVLGLTVSFKLDWQPGPCIVLVLTTLFALAMLRGRLARA